MSVTWAGGWFETGSTFRNSATTGELRNVELPPRLPNELPTKYDQQMTSTIICATCQEEVPRTGRGQRRCPPCARERAREQTAESYRRHAERQKAERRARYAANREAELSYVRTRNYGLTDEELLVILSAQSGRCPICLEPLLWPRVSVDHCHDTGKVRGLLHGPCNTGMGQLGDDPDRCDRAAAYLRAAAS
jgi:hypothetical protein